MNTNGDRTNENEIVCQGCGARFDRLPSFTCPRCGTALCKSGCDGCTARCARNTNVNPKDDDR